MEIEQWLENQDLDLIADHYEAAFVALPFGKIVKLASRTAEIDVAGLIQAVAAPDLSKKLPPRTGHRCWFRFELPTRPPRVVRVYGIWVRRVFFVGVVADGDGPEIRIGSEDRGDLNLAHEFLEATYKVLASRSRKRRGGGFPSNEPGSTPGNSGAESFAGSVWPPKKPSPN